MLTSPMTRCAVPREPIDRGTLIYHRERLRNRIHECVYRALLVRHEQDGVTRADLAARLGKDKAQISRWLSGPSNWTLDTVSDLLLALNVDLELSTCLTEDRAAQNYVHPLMEKRGEPSGEVWMMTSGSSQLTRGSFRARQQTESDPARSKLRSEANDSSA